MDGNECLPAGPSRKPIAADAPARRRPASSYDRRVQIAAAKARVSIDRRLCLTTPEWIVRLWADLEEPSQEEAHLLIRNGP